MTQLEFDFDRISPFYPTNHTIAGKKLTQNEAFEVFRKDQCMRTAAWLQRGGEFYFEHELNYIKESK